MEKQKSNWKSKIKKAPIFILLLINIIIIMSIIIYIIYLRFVPYTTLSYDGYAVSGKELLNNLLDPSFNTKDNIKALKVQDQDMVYKKYKSYYIGAAKEDNINLDFPIYVNNNLALYNLSEDSTLITSDMEKVSGFKGFTLTSGAVYNSNTLERADYNDYILMKNEENVYVNTKPINIDTGFNQYEIPINSIINFTDEFISYYTLDGEYFVYNNIVDIDYASKIKINEYNKEFTYQYLLIKLGIIKEETKKDEVVEEPVKEEPENNDSKETTKEDAKIEDGTLEGEIVEGEVTGDIIDGNIEGGNNAGISSGEKKWQKPVVKCSDFSSNVYTASADLKISDPSGAIDKSITFTFYKDGKVAFRKSATSSGIVKAIGMIPNSKYKIEGSYIYKTEDGTKKSVTILQQEIQTMGTENINAISLAHENGEIESNKIEIKNLKIVSDLTDEAIYGIQKAEFIANDVKYTVSSALLRQMISGKEVVYQTPKTLKSNENYNYEIKLYDTAGNEMKVINNTGSTKTSKQAPTVDVKINKQNVVSITLGLNLKNEDKIELKNYKYIIYSDSGEIVKQENLQQTENTILLESLDPNKTYNIKIFADYDLDNGKGLVEKALIGEGKFTTQNLNTLGFLNLNVTKENVTQHQINIAMKINDTKTDNRLIQILDKVEISIKDQNQNNIQTINLTNEQEEKLKGLENLPIEISKLQSNTEYTIQINATVKQGSFEQEITVNYTLKKVKTLKKTAKVEIKNEFVTANMIDFDMKITDTDEAILIQPITVELRNKDNKLVKATKIESNQDYQRFTYEKLNANENYTIKCYVAEYNEGVDDSTYKNNYLIGEFSVITQVGISGSVGLTSLKKETTGKNLVDVTSNTKWYSKNFDSGYRYKKDYNEKTNTLTLGFNQCYVYDLRDYIGEEITISGTIWLDDSYKSTTAVYIQNSKSIGASCTQIKNIPKASGYEDAMVFQTKVTVGKDGYVGFYLNGTEGYFNIKDLQIELGGTKTLYEEYKYNLFSNIEVNLTDERNEITTNDYYLKVYKNGQEVSMDRYEEIKDGKVEHSIKRYETVEDMEYKMELIVKIRDREYVINTVTFDTSYKEIVGISSVEDYLQIQPNGAYIVLADLNLRNPSSSAKYRFGNDYLEFYGTIDFNGHTVSKDVDNNPVNDENQESIQGANSSITSYMFNRIGKGAHIKNLVLDFYIDNTLERADMWSLFYVNQGTISNIMVNLKMCRDLANIDIGLMGYSNGQYGVIENFVVHLETPLYLARIGSGVCVYSSGVVRNGYVYGEPIKAVKNIIETQERNIGGVVYNVTSGGSIENVFNLSSIEFKHIEKTYSYGANITEYAQTGATIQNVYSINPVETINNSGTKLSNGPNVFSVSTGAKTYNSYYFCDQTYKNSINSKTTKLALIDKDFQNQLLNANGYNEFLIDGYVDIGYYPQVNMENCMPNQEYIQLPDVKDQDLADLLSLEVLDGSNEEYKIVKFNIYNPSGENISNIAVQNLDVEIQSQEYADGKSIVIATIKNPKKCVSSYEVKSITTKGAYNIAYTRNYENGERTIYVDFYKLINSKDDWYKINDSPAENYKLMTDIDFLNESTKMLISKTYTGIIEGNGHTIKNIFIPENSQSMFYYLNGTLRNLNVENYNQITKNQNNVGFIRYAYVNAVVDNVHIKGMNLGTTNANNTNYTGGIFAQSTESILQNSSVTDIKIRVECQANSITIGGLVGDSSYCRINNCFVQDADIYVKTPIISRGIGGIIGRENSSNSITIRFCYTTGKIIGDCNSIGGIYGFTNSYAKNCYSTMEIKSQTDIIGGIGGQNNTTESNTNHMLYLGNIYSTKSSKYVKRIIGNNTYYATNYAYKGQLINGFKKEEQLGATLLEEEQIFDKNTYIDKLEFENAFNYDELEKGILPKLNDTNGKLLPGQKDTKLEVADLEVKSITASKNVTTETAIVRIEIYNPQKVNITKVNVENMDITITKTFWQDGVTYIDLTGKPTKYYDSYELNKIIYEKEDKTEVEVGELAKIDTIFYKNIKTIDDWNEIDQYSAQNYKLIGNLDFTGINKISTNLSIGRLETNGEIRKISNISVTLNSGNSGFIKEITNNLENIDFENITVTNTATSNYTGLIMKNTADVKTVNFSNITINSPKVSYVGIVGYNMSFYMENIKLNTINVTGNSYLGGFAGVTNSGDFSNIIANNITIQGTGSYIGGVFGTENNSIVNILQNVEVTNSNIKGVNYVGGISGYWYTGIGYVTNQRSINNEISGGTYVGGAYGWFQCSDWTYRDKQLYFYVEDCNIKGYGTYIGGICGKGYYINDAYVSNCTISGTSSSSVYVGGAIGQGGYEIKRIGTYNNIITSNGSYAGGIMGYKSDTDHNILSSHSTNNTIKASNYAGGIVGALRIGSIQYCYSNSEVTVSNVGAGGLVGYLNNYGMTNANYISRIKYNYVASNKVAGNKEVGGLVGSLYETVYGAIYYNNNFIQANINSNDPYTVSLGIGKNKEENSKMPNTYVYKYSKINGVYISPSNDTYKEQQMLTQTNLKTQSTYTNVAILNFGTSYYDYSSLSKNKYPYVKCGSITDKQPGVELPTDPINTMNLFARSTNIFEEEIPTANIYQTDVDKINIEFSNIDENSYFTIKTKDGNEIIIDNTYITNRIYTLEYDYKTDYEITITNGFKNYTQEIEAKKIQNKLLILENEYLYLEDNILTGNEGQKDGQYVNLYEGKALTQEGNICDLSTMEIEEKNVEGIHLLEEVKPIATSTYNNQKIETYYNCTKITTSEGQSQYKEDQIFIKNNNIFMIDGDMDIYANKVILDYYNEKKVETVLGTNGKLNEILTQLKYPVDFENKNIEQINTNAQTNDSIMLVYYKTGKVIGFNYITGEEVYNNNKKQDISLADYIKENMKATSVEEDMQKATYKIAQDLKEKLETKPIEELQKEIKTTTNEDKTSNNTQDKTNKETTTNNSTKEEDKTNNVTNKNTLQTEKEEYITSYNAKTKTYEVYKTQDILNVNESNTESENEKINKDQKLIDFYMNKSQDKLNIKNIGVATITLIVFAIIIILVIMNKKKNRN